MPAGQIVLFVIGTIIVIAGAYYVTYYVGSRATRMRPGGTRNIVLRDRFAISKDKSFCLLEIHGKVYIVGVTNQSMTLLDTLPAEELDAGEQERHGAQAMGPGGLQNKIVRSFASFLDSRMKKSQGGDGEDDPEGKV